MPEPLTGAEVGEIESLIELTRLRGWKFLKIIFRDHRTHCLEQSHRFLKTHQDRKAGEWLARSEEPARLIALIQERKDELEQKREKA
jgi:hypothetical protein